MPLSKAAKKHIDAVADSAATLQLAAEDASARLTKAVVNGATSSLVARVAMQQSSENRRRTMHAAARSIRETQAQLQRDFAVAMREARSIAREFAARQVALEAEPLIATETHALVLTPALPDHDVEAMWTEHAGAAMARKFGSAAIAEAVRWRAGTQGAEALPRALGNVAQRIEAEREMHSVTQAVGAFNEAKRDKWLELKQQGPAALPGLPSFGKGGASAGDPFDNAVREIWSAVLDTKTCSVCWGLDGTMVKIGERFPEGAETPLHGHCFPPGEQVLGPDGYRAIESIRPGAIVFGGLSGLPRHVLRNNVRQYDGPLIRVTTADGAVLSMTSDHPVLTRSGWREASKLRVSDELFSQLAQAPVLGGDPMSREAHDGPPPLEQKSVLCHVGLDVRGGVVPMARVNLHSDAQRGNGQIDIERTHGHLRHNVESLSDEGRKKHTLDLAGFADLGAAFRLVNSSDGRLWLAPDGGMRGGREGPAARGACLAHAQEHRGRTAADGNPTPDENLANGPTGATEASGDAVLREPVLGVERDDQITVDFQGRDHTDHLMPLSGVSNPIVALETLHYRGPVYNFAVELEESFQVGSVIVHNCRCSVITAFIPAELERYLPGAELDYDALKADIKDYMGSRKFDVGEGVRHAKRYVDDVLSQRGHSPVVLTSRFNNRRDYFPNINRPRAPLLRH